MPYVTSTQVARALEELATHHPLLVFTVPAMCKNGVEPVPSQKAADDAAKDASRSHYDGRDETQFLKDYTAVPGGPPGKPFYSPARGTRGNWVRSTYPSSSLQAQRKERLGRMFLQSGVFFYPFGSDWSEFADRVRAPVSKVMKVADNDVQLVPLFALASWFFRDREVTSTQDLLDLAKSELKIPDELIGTVYDDSIPAEAEAIAIGAERISREDLAAIVGAVPPPPTLSGGFGDLITTLEEALKRRRLVLGGDIVGQIVRAWAARDIVILVGAGGTGKTTLAKEIVEALKGKEILPLGSFAEVAVNEDFGVSDLLGYESIAGGYVDRPFTARILRSKSPLHPHVLLIEELNLAAVESYLQPILHAIESGSQISLAGKESLDLPQDTLVLATCNSPRDEPETRVLMSGPTKRRATVIQMPNLLYEEWAESKMEGLREVIARILSKEREEVEMRIGVGRGSWLDLRRLARLGKVTSVDDLDLTAGTTLMTVVGALLDSQEGRRWMTLGPLRDVLIPLVWAETEEQPRVLGQLAVSKLLQQAQSLEVAALVEQHCAALPNADLIAAAAQELIGPGDTVRPLL
jgi:AAA domain (dynein-related subfamily)